MVKSRRDFLVQFTPEVKAFFWEPIVGGLGDYENLEFYSLDARRDHTPSVRAAIRNAHIIGRAKRMLIETPQVRMSNHRGRVMFIVNDLFRVSFKKLDRNLRSRYTPTKTATAFMTQTLPNFEMPAELTNLVAGYQFSNELESDFEVFIACPADDGNEWVLRLSAEEAKDFFAPTTDSSAPQYEKKVWLRKGATKKTQAHESAR